MDLIIGYLTGGDDFFMLAGSGSCYHLSSIKLNWTQAKANCEARGAMLFCPETEEELTVAGNFLKTSELSLFLRFFYILNCMLKRGVETAKM